MTRGRIAAAAVAVLCLFLAWQHWQSGERAVRSRLHALASDLNGTRSDGTAALLRAAHFGDYFTDDVIVELGEGAQPIVGRATVIGMAARLERRTSSSRLRFEDIVVQLRPSATEAEVSLTASFMRADDSGDSGLDAREFALEMVKSAGTWRIARAAAVNPLR